MSTQPPADDAWPTPESPTMVAARETVVQDAPPPAHPPAYPPDEPPPSRRIGEGMLLAIGVIVLVVAGLLIAWFLTHRHHSSSTTTVVVTTSAAPGTTAPAGAGARVTVPSVTGLSLTAARAKLSALGLKSTTTPVSSSQPAGTVVDQSPAPAATLAKGSTLTLSVAKATPVAVPDVSGQQQAAATSALQAAGLTAHVVSVHSSQPQGQVTAQHPAAGAKLAKGASVRLNVSDGSGSTSTSPAATTTSPAATTTGAAAPAPAPVQPTTASVPDVTQSELQAAVQKLDAAGFLASIAYVPGTDPLGTIDAQTPTGGSSAKTRSQVTINASSGPGQKTQETVPDATGQTLEQAVSTLNGAHLRLIFLKLPVTDRTQVGKIVRQTPLAGKQAPQNAQVLVYLGVLSR